LTEIRYLKTDPINPPDPTKSSIFNFSFKLFEN
jgi:hypothetical protein